MSQPTELPGDLRPADPEAQGPTISTSAADQEPLTRDPDGSAVAPAGDPGVSGASADEPAPGGSLAWTAAAVDVGSGPAPASGDRGLWTPRRLLIGVLLVAAALRLLGLDWDAGHHLHPDERFITSVASAIRFPSPTQYFDARSPLNPNALPNVSYVYGTFSLFVVRALAELIQQAATAVLPAGEPGGLVARLQAMASYDQIHLLGRVVSVLADLLTILLIYLIGRRLHGEGVGLLAALFAALAVLMIQTAHFFTVEAPLTFLVTLAFYFGVRAAQSGSMRDWCLFGAATGLAAACKVTAFMLLPIGVVAAGVLWYRATRVGAYEERRRFLYEDLVTGLFGFGALAFVAFRFAQPYAFAGPGLFDIGPNQRFLDVFTNFQRIGTGETDVPFNHSWAGTTPYLWQLMNMGLWGLGIPLTVAAWAGFGLACWGLIRDPVRWHMHAITVAWVGLNFLYWGMQFTKLMRYLLPIYPQLLVLAAVLVVSLWRWAAAAGARRALEVTEASASEGPPEAEVPIGRSSIAEPPAPQAVDAGERVESASGSTMPGAVGQWVRAYGPLAAKGFAIVVVGWTALYALAFASIYTRPHPRVEASRWIYENVPYGTPIASEHWDDRLPLGMPGRDPARYPAVELALYNEDTPEKREQLIARLNDAQLIVESSNRLYGSIPKIPRRYPMTTRYFQALFNGELGFERVAEFTSRPGLLGLELNDDDAEESFTVYDHPKVTIFRKTGAYSAENTRRILESVSLEEVLRGQKPASAGSTGLLLTPEERAAVRETGTWSEIFDRTSPINAVALPAWYLLIQAIGLAAVPLMWWMGRWLGDAGYPLAKTLGIVVVAYVPWLAASLHLMPFSRASIFLAFVLLLLASGVVVVRAGRTLWRDLRARAVPIVATEAIFLLAFLGFTALRAVNPDLWHSAYGGEKPMDFAYLNAVIKSDFFPPYDPWLAGGYINYYYFGHVIVGSLIKLTGVLPWVAYNLAIPMIAALTAVSIASAVYNLLIAGPHAPRARQRWAVGGMVAGTLLGVVCGNLHGIVQIVEYFIKLDRGAELPVVPVVTGIVAFVRGVALRVSAPPGTLPPFQFDFWGPTRVITTEGIAPITEFPYFTFLYGDLHAHMVAMPIGLLLVGLAINLVRLPDRTGFRPTVAPGWLGQLGGSAVSWSTSPLGLTLLAAALGIGVIRMTNSWDYPTYLGVLAVATLIGERTRARGSWAPAVRGTAVSVGVLLIASQIVVLPFLRRYELFYTGVELTKTQTIVPHYLIIMGAFLAILAVFLAFQLAALRPRLVQSGLALLGAVSVPSRSYAVAAAPARTAPPATDRVAVAVCAFGLFAAALFATRGVPVVTVAGIWFAAVALVVALRQPGPRMLFTSLLAATALAVTAGVDVFVLKGDVGRMNTVFKFYLQAWLFLSIVAGVVLTLLARRAWGSRWLLADRWRRVALGVVVAPILITLIYPVLGTPSKVQHRFVHLPPSLDGMEFMSQARYIDKERDLRLPDDFVAINWMLDNIQGTPVIVEGLSPLYHWRNRVANFTGLPAVVGWDWHQSQQRGDYASMIQDRVRDVEALFRSAAPEEARRILDRYRVEYIYVGEQERVYYPGPGLEKFDRMVGSGLERVFQHGAVTIYRVVR